MRDADSQTQTSAPEQGAEAPLEIDRGFTYRVTIASLIVGVLLAGVAALILFSLTRPLTADEQGNVNWSVSGILFPAAGRHRRRHSVLVSVRLAAARGAAARRDPRS
jgi:hypothetical protein